MKVKELIKYLETLPEEATVYLASDKEGSKQAEIAEYAYIAWGETDVVLVPKHKFKYIKPEWKVDFE